MKKCNKKGLVLFTIGAACGALCYQIIKNKKNVKPSEDDFEDFDDDFMDDATDESDLGMTQKPATDNDITD